MPWGAAAAVVGAVGSSIGASSSNKAAQNAANTQAAAATESARIQAEGTKEALGFQKGVYTDQRALGAPLTVAQASARVRQMVMAGIPVEEARAYYNQTVKAIQDGAAGGVNDITAAATPESATPVSAEEWIKANGLESDFARHAGKRFGTPDSYMNEVMTNWTHVGNYKSAQQLGQEKFDKAAADKAGVAAKVAAKVAAEPLGTTKNPGDFPELGDLSEFAPKEFDENSIYEDPGYRFRLDEGNKALQRLKAAQGQFYSGALVKASDRYNQDYASGEFGKAYDRFTGEEATKWNKMAALSGTEGLDAITTAGSDFGDAAAGLTTAGANATATGVANAGNARATGYANQQDPLAAAFGGATGALTTYLPYKTAKKIPKQASIAGG